MKDSSLCCTPVFRKRLDRAAGIIQSLTRGVLTRKMLYEQRRNMAAVEIQRVVRGSQQQKVWAKFYTTVKAAQRIQKIYRGGLARQFYRSNVAATQIQRIVRGFVGRLNYQVRRLENMLATVRTEHREEMDQISKDKDARIATMEGN